MNAIRQQPLILTGAQLLRGLECPKKAIWYRNQGLCQIMLRFPSVAKYVLQTMWNFLRNVLRRSREPGTGVRSLAHIFGVAYHIWQWAYGYVLYTERL
jgi:hypothetical protein